MHSSRTPSEIDRFIGEWLHRLRCEYNLTQAEMGKYLGISAQQYQKYEKGKNRLSASKLYELSENLSFDPANIYTYIQNRLGAQLPV